MARAQALAGTDQAAGPEQHVILDNGPVEHQGPHADQAAVAYRAGVQYGPVSTVTSSPTTSGRPPGVYGASWVTWATQLSCRLLRAPMRIWLTSPRTTAPGQTETSSPSSTWPITTAEASIQTLEPKDGRSSPQRRIRVLTPPSLSCYAHGRPVDDETMS